MISLYLDEKVTPLSERVYLALRESIIRGDLNPGNRLLVLDIANELKISQAPVREALERLKQEGLITSKANRGSIVSNISSNEIEEIYALRELIEGFAVKNTMAALTANDIEYLYQVYMNMKKATEQDDLYKLIDCDMEFHRFFYERCKNKEVLSVWTNMEVKVRRFIAVTNKIYFPNLDAVADTHLDLIRVLEKGDLEDAGKLFVEHMKEVWWRMKKNHTEV